jgi:hypothetical protein
MLVICVLFLVWFGWDVPLHHSLIRFVLVLLLLESYAGRSVEF